MIKNLTHSVTFPTNGISLKGEFSFQPGITAIIGDNGNGKTFGSIELTRYLLFGKKALRGPAKDYKSLIASGTFTIKGVDYTVERTPKGETLKDQDGQVLAVNAEAVNQKFIEILGYNLDVFDVVNASVQKESDKLSKMLPTARMKLIDQVIGLASYEGVEKACKDEAKALKREADALSDNLVVLTPPTKPEGYLPSSVLKGQLDDGKRDQETVRLLQAIIDKCGPEPTVVEPPVGDLEALQAREDARRDLTAKIQHAEEQLKVLPEATHTAEQLNEAEEWLNYVAALDALGPRPAMSEEEAQAILDAWDHRAAHAKLGDVEVDCPKCQHSFKPGADLGPEPRISRAVATAELRANEAWREPPATPTGSYNLNLDKSAIAKGRLALARSEDRQQLIVLSQLPLPKDESQELLGLLKAKANYDFYLKSLSEWKARGFEAEKAQVRLDETPWLDFDLEALNKAYVEARVYETQLDEFVKAEDRQSVTKALIAEKLDNSKAYKKGADALAKARSEVKAYLAPSLSRVSSSLIHEMSGGVLSNMIVDEDMNVTVNGQDIATLSGAGSTVANLALRLALGQVLIRNIFPVFIADEADADLSNSRAQFTAECLANLKGQLEQIIVITHKEVTVADNIITR